MAEILIVDDDCEYCESFAAVLALEGHSTRVAVSGPEGLRALRDRLPDVIILDVDMPDFTGPEVAWQMLAEDVGKERIPILFISANPDLPRVAASVGTSYFLAKPFDLRVVRVLLDRILNEHLAPSWPEH